MDAVVALGRGCNLYKRDLQKVYHQFPVDSKDYPFIGYIWDNHFISTPFSRWDCALQLWRANALLQPLPGSHHNKAVWCLIIWTISSAFPSYDRSIQACIVALIKPHKQKSNTLLPGTSSSSSCSSFLKYMTTSLS